MTKVSICGLPRDGSLLSWMTVTEAGADLIQICTDFVRLKSESKNGRSCSARCNAAKDALRLQTDAASAMEPSSNSGRPANCGFERQQFIRLRRKSAMRAADAASGTPISWRLWAEFSVPFLGSPQTGHWCVPQHRKLWADFVEKLSDFGTSV